MSHAEILGSQLPSSNGHALFCGDTMVHFAPEPGSVPLFAHRTLSDWNVSHVYISSASPEKCNVAHELISGCYSGSVYDSASHADCMAADAEVGAISALASSSPSMPTPRLLGRFLSWTYITQNTAGDWTVQRPHPQLLPAPDQGEGLCVFVGIDTNLTAAPHTVRSVERAGAAFLAEFACSGVLEEVREQISEELSA
jgi:hypothetical protein